METCSLCESYHAKRTVSSCWGGIRQYFCTESEKGRFVDQVLWYSRGMYSYTYFIIEVRFFELMD